MLLSPNLPLALFAERQARRRALILCFSPLCRFFPSCSHAGMLAVKELPCLLCPISASVEVAKVLQSSSLHHRRQRQRHHATMSFRIRSRHFWGGAGL